MRVFAYTADLAQPDEKDPAAIPPIATQHGAEAARLVDSREALARDPAHPGALAALADLYLRQQAWADAADVLLRCARVERDLGVRRDVFLHLGVIYTQHLPDRRVNPAGLRRGNSPRRALGMDPRAEQDLVGVDVADASHHFLIH